MKIHVSKLTNYPEVMYLAEINKIIENNFIEMSNLKKYHGCKLGNYIFDYNGTLSSVSASDMELEDLVKMEGEVLKECKLEIRDYGSAYFDHFILKDGVFSKRIINGICIKHLNNEEFKRFALLLACLNVKRYYFICPDKPTIDIDWLSVEQEGLEYGGSKYYMIKFYDRYSEMAIKKKLFICRNCGKLFSVSPDQQKFYKSRGLELPKRCTECRKIK